MMILNILFIIYLIYFCQLLINYYNTFIIKLKNPMIWAKKMYLYLLYGIKYENPDIPT